MVVEDAESARRHEISVIIETILFEKVCRTNGDLACVCRGGGGAGSTQHHQGNGPASSLGCASMGTEQCGSRRDFVVEIEAVVEVL